MPSTDERPQSAARGRFITIEGIEGAGKSTQIRLLAAALTAAGFDAVVTREPGGTPGAEAIRHLLLDDSGYAWPPASEALLHYAARRDHLDRVVLPACAAGRWVLCDRFADSTMAYQGYGQEAGRAFVHRLHALVLDEFSPDLTVILDLDVDEGLARAQSRSPGGDRYEKMTPAFHARVRSGFLEIARAEPRRCAVIDAAGSADTVHRQICNVVKERLGVTV